MPREAGWADSGSAEGQRRAGRWFLWFRGKKRDQVWTAALSRRGQTGCFLCGLVSFFGFCLLSPGKASLTLPLLSSLPAHRLPAEEKLASWRVLIVWGKGVTVSATAVPGEYCLPAWGRSCETPSLWGSPWRSESP